MSSLNLIQLILRKQRVVFVTSQRYRKIRGPFAPEKRSFEDRNRVILAAHRNKKLELADLTDKPVQYKLRPQPPEPKIASKERKLSSLAETSPPYQKYPQGFKDARYDMTWYDPLFNPHLHEGRNEVNPEEEPFNAIYADSKSESANEYTKVRNITNPELWEYVERLARLKIAPEPKRRKSGDPIKPMPSGYIPPPETAPDLPYFVPRTRNYILPVYYRLDSDPELCCTIVKQVSGDLWQLEEDLRTHLQSISGSPRKILTSVLETDEEVHFRGRHLHQVVAWLHEKGF